MVDLGGDFCKPVTFDSAYYTFAPATVSSLQVKAIWEMAEMDCRAARQRDVLCDELEHEDLLGAVKVSQP